MSYEPTVWSDGDTITSEKLNKLEERVNSLTHGGDFFIVNLSTYIVEQNLDYGNGTQEIRRILNFKTDKTDIEISDALSDNMVPLFCFTIEDYGITNTNLPPVGRYAMIPSVEIRSESGIDSYEFFINIPDSPSSRHSVSLYPLKLIDSSDTYYQGTWGQ